MGLAVAPARAISAVNVLRGDCACGQTAAAGCGRRAPGRRKTAIVQTSRDDGTVRWSIDVDLVDRIRFRCVGDDQFEAFHLAVAAAGRGSQDGSHVVGEHVCRLKSECDVRLLRNRLAHRSSSLLDPALRICMETTRASLLWQAAAVRPEPERMPSLRCGADSRSCIARVWGCSCFAILTNVAARRTWRDAPSSRRNLIGRVKRWDFRI